MLTRIGKKTMIYCCRLILPIGVSLALASACSNVEFTHVKPGQSAHMAVLTRTAPLAHPVARAVPFSRRSRQAGMNFAAIEPLPLDVSSPGLPDGNTLAKRAVELMSQGEAAMQAGQTGEAILVFEEAVRVEPSSSKAWSRLEQLYKSAGRDDKAGDAARKAREAASETNALIPNAAGL